MFMLMLMFVMILSVVYVIGDMPWVLVLGFTMLAPILIGAMFGFMGLVFAFGFILLVCKIGVYCWLSEALRH